jgi:endonuclease III
VFNRQIIRILISRGDELLSRPFEPVQFTKNNDADELLNDIENTPHAFILACVMDRQIKAERAWLIPFLIKEETGRFDFEFLKQFDAEYFKKIFQSKRLHRFNEIMSRLFYDAVQLIGHKYNGNASLIWSDSPSSATIVRRFLEFKGVGIKIATMAANILSREFKIPMQDRICIDISPDVQVKRVFTRLGFISKNATNDQLIYTARELYPHYPGIFDLSAWEIGRKWCRPVNPSCSSCYLNEHCPKLTEPFSSGNNTQ